MDGELRGALPPCPEPDCKGRLRLEGPVGGPQVVFCGGAFDEELGTFVRCYFRVPAEAVERLPWRTGPKTEGRWMGRCMGEVMWVRVLWCGNVTDELAEEASFQVTVDTQKADDLFEGLDLGTVDGKKVAVTRFVELAREEGINVPETDSEARVKLGTLIMNNPGASGAELMAKAEETFGTRKSVVDKVQRSAVGTVVPENARSGNGGRGL